MLYDLKHEKWSSSAELGDTTLNIGTIEGGQAANAVPDSASALLMFRVIESPEIVLKRVKVCTVFIFYRDNETTNMIP